MNKYILYLGLNDKKTKKQEIKTKEAFNLCNNILLNYTDGATVYEASGIYKHKNNKIIIEKTLRIELLFINEKIIKNIIKELKRAFNQESVILQKESVKSQLL